VSFTFVTLLLFAGLLLGMLAASEIGRRLGIARIARDPEGLPKGVGAVEGAVFALLGLLLAFSFSGAASRFEDRRHLIREETNAIGTAYLRVDLLPADAQPELRDLFRRYLDGRLQTYRNVSDVAATQAKLVADQALQKEIWSKAVSASMRPGVPTPTAQLLLPALNDMIDITTTRVVATRNHPPIEIFFMLAGISVVSALLVGYGASVNKNHSWLHTLVFSVVLSLTAYIILDLEYPRFGLIRVDGADITLEELKESMR